MTTTGHASWIGIASLTVAVAVGCGGGQAAGPSGPEPGPAAAPGDAPAAEQAASPAAPADIKEICAPKAAMRSSPDSADGFAALFVDRDKRSGLETFGDRSKAKGDAKKYSMKDLKALEAKRAWRELLAHLQDIAPAKRNAAWEALLEKSVTEFANTEAKDHPIQVMILLHEVVQDYPELKKSKEIMARRAELGIKGLKECYRQSYGGVDCTDFAFKFAEADPDNRKLALAMAKLVVARQYDYVGIPLFVMALKDRPGDAACTDEHLGKAVVAGLGLPPKDEMQKGARTIATDLCWDGVRATVVEALIKDPTGYYRTHACELLSAKGELR